MTQDQLNNTPQQHIKGAANTPRTLSAQECQDKVQNWALFYVQRYGSSRKTVEQYLHRKIKRAFADRPDIIGSLCETTVPATLLKMEDWGYLNDAAYARTLYRRLLREGRAHSIVRQKMQEKGLDAQVIQDTINALQDELNDNQTPINLKLAGAVRLMQRRRMGCYGGRHADAPQKAYGVFARAGYDYSIARQALQLSLDEANMVLEPLGRL